MALGRGAGISAETGYLDDKYFGGLITFMNPMRDFLKKEIALFNYLNKIDIITQEPLAKVISKGTRPPFFQSIDLLVDHFISEMQLN